MGRNAAGVKGISPRSGDSVADISVVPGGDEEHVLLTVCENGYGKLTEVSEYPLQGRGGQGVIGVRTPPRNGELVALSCLRGDEQLMMITRGGQIVRIPADSISHMGRSTQGVRLMKTEEGDTVTSVVRLDAEVEDDEEADEEGADDGAE
jgi:DNA gyrase subunit A